MSNPRFGGETPSPVNQGVPALGKDPGGFVRPIKVTADGTVETTATFTPSGTQTVVFQRPTTSDLSEAVINAAGSGDNTIVAGVGGQRVRVFKIFLVADAAVNVTFKDATGGAALTGAMVLTASGAITLDFDGEPWFTTALAGAFVINLSAAIGVRGRVYYTQL